MIGFAAAAFGMPLVAEEQGQVLQPGQLCSPDTGRAGRGQHAGPWQADEDILDDIEQGGRRIPDR